MNEDAAAAIEAKAQFQLAGAMHQQGRLKEAQAIYEAILKSDPKQFDSLHMLGVIAAQSKNYGPRCRLARQSNCHKSNKSCFLLQSWHCVAESQATGRCRCQF